MQCHFYGELVHRFLEAASPGRFVDHCSVTALLSEHNAERRREQDLNVGIGLWRVKRQKARSARMFFLMWVGFAVTPDKVVFFHLGKLQVPHGLAVFPLNAYPGAGVLLVSM